jgi:hypothetical protein
MRGGILPRTGSTFIDFANPALEAGSVSTASLWWGQETTRQFCTNAFTIKIFRPPETSTKNWPNYTLVGERGPFDSRPGLITVPISPPIAVQRGDVIAVAEIESYACGGVAFAHAAPGSSILEVFSDFNGGPLTGSLSTGVQLMARASTSNEVLEGVIAAGGSVAGGFGSFFRTSVDLANLYAIAPIAGRIVFHPAGRSAAAGDPSVPYSLAAGAMTTFRDIMTSMNASGLGSFDVVSSNSPPPEATIRVFNDQGAAGTNGFVEDVIPPAAALRANEGMSIAIPADLTNYRVNVGIRTLDAAAVIQAQTFNSDGVRVHVSQPKLYAPNYFEQVPLSMLLDFTPPAGGRAMIAVGDGVAIMYWTITDNRTNDSAIKFGLRP